MKTGILTQKQAQELCDALDLSSIFGDMEEENEERDLLLENNPDLYEAYQALMKIADDDIGPEHGQFGVGA